jgi:hypothetical protein
MRIKNISSIWSISGIEDFKVGARKRTRLEKVPYLEGESVDPTAR